MSALSSVNSALASGTLPVWALMIVAAASATLAAIGAYLVWKDRYK